MRIQLNGGNTNVSLERLLHLVRSGDITVAKGTFVQEGDQLVVATLDCESRGILDLSQPAVVVETQTAFQRTMDQGS